MNQAQERVNSFSSSDSLDDFQTKTTAKPVPTKQEIDEIAEATGFSRGQTKPAPPAPRSRRYTTGRNQQLNLKVTAEALQRFYALADKLEQPLGEVFDRAVKALEATQ